MPANELLITDRTAQLNSDNFSQGREGATVALVVLHDTAGTSDAPHNNNQPAAVVQSQAVGTANYLLKSRGGPSVHFLVGPELTGAWVQRLCRETDTAYHAAGYPPQNVFVTDSGVRLEGNLAGVGRLNRYSIGIERYGTPGEKAADLPKQKAAMVSLCLQLARAYNLKSRHFVSHDWLQLDRTDGNIFLADVQRAVDEMWANSSEGGAGVNQPGEIQLNGFTIRGEIGARWGIFKDEKLSLATFGLPLSAEYLAPDGTTRQDFEKITLVFNPNLAGAWRVQGAHVKR